MGSSRRILLEGLEVDLVNEISLATTEAPPRFRFQDPGLKDLVLAGGRHLFVNDLPEIEDILQTSADFQADREPNIAVYTQSGAGAAPSSSSGARMESNLRLVLRFGVVPETAKELLEELVLFIHKSLKGQRVGAFILKGADVTARPAVYKREGDDHAFATATMRFWAVARPFAST